jgi:DUF1009 family protein
MSRRLAVVAGSGTLAPQVVAAALAEGDAVRAFCLSPLSLPDGAEQQPASIADLGALLQAIWNYRASHLVLAGAITLTDGDRHRLAVLLGGEGQPTGDASLSRLAMRLEQLTGAVLIGPDQVAPGLTAGTGRLAGPAANEQQMAAARLALKAARQIGALDIGQAAVVAGARVVAVEDAAGTDELLARVQRYRSMGLLGDTTSAPLVLAKACKPQQPLFVDLPAIGPDTVSGAMAAGVGVIALEAGRSLLLDRVRTLELAEAVGIAIVGLAVDG